jgi:hypothetical protein
LELERGLFRGQSRSRVFVRVREERQSTVRPFQLVGSRSRGHGEDRVERRDLFDVWEAEKRE